MHERNKNIALLTAMAKKRLTGQQLARRAAIHPVTVSFILNQRTIPKPATAARIAAALDKTPAELGWALDRKEVPQ